jgi:hypothetical protein
MSLGLATAGIAAVVGLVFLSWTDPAGPLAGLIDIALRSGFWGLLLLASARLAAWGVGSRLTGLAHLAWDGTAGLGLLVGVLLAAGLLPGGFRVATISAVLGGGVVLAILRARVDPVSRLARSPSTSTAVGWLTPLLVVVTVGGLAWNRVPPLFFDTLAYHFAQPELWLVNGRIAPEVWSLHSWFPPGMSVLYGIGLAVGGEAWANDANLLVGLLLLGVAFDLGRRLFGPAAGLVSVVVLLSLPMVLYALAIPAADFGHGLLTVAALASLSLRRTSGHACWTPRAGLCAAGAVLTKYLGLLVPVALGAAWLLFASGSRARFREALLFVAPVALLVAPWLIANTTTVGNPVAPALAGVVPTRGLAEGGADSFRVDARGGLPGPGELARLGPRLIVGDDQESRVYPTPAWGWLPLILTPVVVLLLRKDRHLRLLAGGALALFVIWLLTFRWERFLVAASTLLAVAFAGAAVTIWRRGGILRILLLVASVIAAMSITLAIREVTRFTGATSVALGRDAPRAFVERALPTARLYRTSNETLDRASDRVLLLGEMRHYGLRLPRCAPTGFNLHPLVEALRTHDETAEIHRELRRQGFTHMIVDPGWVTRSAAGYPSLALLRERPELLRQFLRSLGAPLAVEGNVALFRIPE